MKHVATYARYSSDNQREASIIDQQRMCRKLAEREGMSISREYVDKAMSGSLEDRPDFRRLVKDIESGEISVLLVDDLSRLSRSINTAATVDGFKYYGTRVICVADGIDTNDKSSKVAVTVKGMMNNLYLDDLKEKVHRGLEGNALNGLSTGGRKYGYRPKPIYSETKKDVYGRPLIVDSTLEIDDEEAAVVKQIFEWVVEGRAYKWIANELNKRGIKSSTGRTWAGSTISSSSQGKLTGILNNKWYIGIGRWGMTENTRHPQTGKKGRRNRSEDEWTVRKAPHLRIISDELWEKVKNRQEIQRNRTHEKQKQMHENARTGRPPVKLLSGLLKCSECGGNLIVVDRKNYKCGEAHRRGDAICKNKKKVNRFELEGVLLASIKSDLFRPEAVEAFKKEVAALLKQRKAAFQPNIRKIKSKRDGIEKSLENLVSSIAENPVLAASPTFSDKIAELERGKLDAERELNTQTEMIQDIEPILPRALDRYQGLTDELPGALSDHMEPFREQIISLLGDEIIMSPQEDGGWEAAYRGNYRGLLRLGDPEVKLSHETPRRGFFID